jgi:hypothetical protein
MLANAEQFNQQAEHANQDGNAGAQQHERENKNQGRFEAAGCRHGDRLDEGRAVQDAPDAIRHSAFSTRSLSAFT